MYNARILAVKFAEYQLLRILLFLSMLSLSVSLTACQRGQVDELPTRVPPPDVAMTAQVLTENAPPEGFREAIVFPQIDDKTLLLSNWRFEATLIFNGVFSGTPREANGTVVVNAWYNQLTQARRVVIEGTGNLFGEDEDTLVEGVRLGTNTFLVRDNTCLGEANGQAAIVADLLAGDLLGGVNRAVPNGKKATVNGEDVWLYAFDAADLVLPQIQQGANGIITVTGGELWLAPERNAIIRFYVNLDVENVTVQLFDTSLPITGTLLLRYDLYDIGVDPNISQPFGC